MGGTLPLITLLVVAVLRWHAVSANDCYISNCEFIVREECQTSETVFCSMKNRPNKQINITAASFPRDVQEIEISDAEVITFEPDAIASLTSLQYIEITNVNTLILQPRSLARGGNPQRITVKIFVAKRVLIDALAFAGWKDDSRIMIEEVDDCQMLSFSVANTQLRSLTLNNINSLVIHESTFGNHSQISNIRAMKIRSLLMKNNAFSSKAHTVWFTSIETFTIHSGALSRNSRIQKAMLERVKYLNIEPYGIEADIVEMKVRDVAMEMCRESTFGGMLGSLSLSSSHIHRTRKNCISANNIMKRLIIESTHFNRIDTSGIYGTAAEVRIKSSTLGIIEKGGLQLNLTELLVENSTMDEVPEGALVVLAVKSIKIRNCTIDVMREGAFSSLSVMQRNGTAHNLIQINNLRIKHPHDGSLQFDQDQRVEAHGLTLDIPCTCDIQTTLGLDASSENESWIDQPLCVINGKQSPLGHYLKEFCTEPTTIPPSETSNELNIMNMDPRTTPKPGQASWSRHSLDQAYSSSTQKEPLVVTITVAVLIGYAVATLLVSPQLRRKSGGGQQSQDTQLSQQNNQQTRRPDPRPYISAPALLHAPESADNATCQESVQSVSTCQTRVGSVGTHTSSGMELERGSKSAQHNTPATQSLTGAPGEPEHHRAVGGDVGNEAGDRAPYRGVAENSRTAHSAGPDSTHTSHDTGQLEMVPLIHSPIPLDSGADGEWWTHLEPPARGESAHLLVTECSDIQPSPACPRDPDTFCVRVPAAPRQPAHVVQRCSRARPQRGPARAAFHPATPTK